MFIMFRILLQNFDNRQLKETTVPEDNNECIILARGEGILLNSNHISLRYHFLREKVLNNEISFILTPTVEKLTDKLIKTLGACTLN